ncbi:MAG: protein kinase, partial [Anaerolineae bacterium]|nr:protein kinase [Gloeobacterales cyanobacterium ES-bin-313]
PSEAIQQKLTVMLDQTSAKSLAQEEVNIAWPLDLLLDGEDQIVGFLMPQAVDARPIVNYYNPKTRLEINPLFNYRDLHRTAHNLAKAVETLHSRGYVIGDLNESNVLVTKKAEVTLVDADSFQVIDGDTVYRCRVGKSEFMPPELQGETLSEVTRTADQDNFALAILIFQTLMEGSHPFAAIYTGQGEPPSLGERIAAGHFCYAGHSVPYRPSSLTTPFALLHPKLQELFIACLIDSQQNPQKRPTACQWCEALSLAEKSLRTCTVNTQHTYGSQLDDCPWCYRKILLNGRDPFPAKKRSNFFPKKQFLPKPKLVSLKYKSDLTKLATAVVAGCMGVALQLLSTGHHDASPDPNRFLVGTYTSAKLQISFCKNSNKITSVENSGLEAFSGFKLDCPDSTLKLSEGIFKHIYPQDYDSALRVQDENSVILDRSYEVAHNMITKFNVDLILKGNTLSPNGLYFASILDKYHDLNTLISSQILLFDTLSNKLLRRLGDGAEQISVITFSPNSKMLAIGRTNGAIQIFNVNSGRLISEIYIEDQQILGLKFIMNGKVLICVGDGIKGYRLVSVKSGKTITEFGLSSFSSGPVAFSPDEKLVALPGSNRDIYIYDVHSGEVLRDFAGGLRATFLAFGKDSETLAVGDLANGITIYAVNNLELSVNRRLQRAKLGR